MARLTEVGYRIVLLPRDGDGHARGMALDARKRRLRAGLFRQARGAQHARRHQLPAVRLPTIRRASIPAWPRRAATRALSARRSRATCGRASTAPGSSSPTSSRSSVDRQRAAAHPRLGHARARRSSAARCSTRSCATTPSISASSAPSSSAPTTPRASSTSNTTCCCRRSRLVGGERRQRPVGRHSALGLGAPQLPLGLQGELQALAHRRLSDPQPSRCRARCAPATTRSRLALGDLAELYGAKRACHVTAHATRGCLQNGNIDEIFQSGLHEFLEDFIASQQPRRDGNFRSLPLRPLTETSRRPC